MSKLVSVVICAYNNWPDLELAIQSALCQSHPSVEIIVVDNSSADATADEVPKRFGDRVQFVRQENRGDSGAYNTGMAIAKGEFIQFLDGDDVLAPDKIERQLEVFLSDPGADVVFGNVRYFRSFPGVAAWTDYDSTEADVGIARLIEREGGCVGAVLAVLFRRRALEKVGRWDESIYVSDSDYELRAILAGCRYRSCAGGPVGFKRIRPGQMGANYSAMLDGMEALWMKALTIIGEERYRAGIVHKLARGRLFRALRAENMSRAEALAKCREARRTCPAAIPLAAFLAVSLVIAVPGGRELARSPRFRPLRRFAAKLFGYAIYG